jgi:hypothetical protein
VIFQGGNTPVEDSELLARFVVFSKWIRKKDQTVKQDAFIPHPYPELSVNRHDGNRDKELSDVGRSVAEKRERTFYGWANVSAAAVRKTKLGVEAAPIKVNPNHANIIGWPKEKNDQKSCALEMAAAASNLVRPSRG